MASVHVDKRPSAATPEVEDHAKNPSVVHCRSTSDQSSSSQEASMKCLNKSTRSSHDSSPLGGSGRNTPGDAFSAEDMTNDSPRTNFTTGTPTNFGCPSYTNGEQPSPLMTPTSGPQDVRQEGLPPRGSISSTSSAGDAAQPSVQQQQPDQWHHQATDVHLELCYSNDPYDMYHGARIHFASNQEYYQQQQAYYPEQEQGYYNNSGHHQRSGYGYGRGRDNHHNRSSGPRRGRQAVQGISSIDVDGPALAIPAPRSAAATSSGFTPYPSSKKEKSSNTATTGSSNSTANAAAEKRDTYQQHDQQQGSYYNHHQQHRHHNHGPQYQYDMYIPHSMPCMGDSEVTTFMPPAPPQLSRIHLIFEGQEGEVTLEEREAVVMSMLSRWYDRLSQVQERFVGSEDESKLCPTLDKFESAAQWSEACQQWWSENFSSRQIPAAGHQKYNGYHYQHGQERGHQPYGGKKYQQGGPQQRHYHQAREGKPHHHAGAHGGSKPQGQYAGKRPYQQDRPAPNGKFTGAPKPRSHQQRNSESNEQRREATPVAPIPAE